MNRTSIEKHIDQINSDANLLNQPIVMDVGTDKIKAGFAGGSKPKVLVDTKVGRPKHLRVMPGGALENESVSSMFVGSKLDEYRGSFILEYPMEKGHVVSGGWDAMEKIWEHIYSRTLLNAKLDEHPVLLTECPLNPNKNRQHMAELFFETFRAPAVFFSAPAVLSLYASGRISGIVLDVGEGVAHCIPVYEGYALQHSITRSDIAGHDVTKYLQLLLRKSGLSFTTTAEYELVKDIKEKACYIKPPPIDSMPLNDATINDNNGASFDQPSIYQLPDGQTVDISSERCVAPEVLFHPNMIGSEEESIADNVVTSIMRSDIDLRPTLFSQVVLAGGSTCCVGFGERLLAEIRSRSPIHTKIRISAPPERTYSAWTGGSILASLSTFKSLWMTKSMYDEFGSSIFHKTSL